MNNNTLCQICRHRIYDGHAGLCTGHTHGPITPERWAEGQRLAQSSVWARIKAEVLV